MTRPGWLSWSRPAAGRPIHQPAVERTTRQPLASWVGHPRPGLGGSCQFRRRWDENFAKFGKLRSDLVGGRLNRLIVLAAAAGVAMSTLSAGAAGAQGAPDVTGKKYSDATATLTNAGFTAKLAAIVGDQLSQDDCLVSSQEVVPSTSPFGPPQFNVGEGGNNKNIVMLSLNCNGGLASAGNAGNSAASPEGRAAKKEQEQEGVEWQRTPAGQKWCAQTKVEKPEWSWDTDPRLAGCRSGG